MFGVALFALGCRTHRDAAKWYAKRYPSEAKHYEFERASLEPLKLIEESYIAIMEGLLKGVNMRMGDPEQLDGYVQRTRVRLQKIREQTRKDYETIESFLKTGGELYFYKRPQISSGEARAGQKHSFETGLIVIRDGEVVYRQLFYGWEVVSIPTFDCEVEKKTNSTERQPD